MDSLEAALITQPRGGAQALGALSRVPRGRRAFLKPVPVPDRAFARIGSHLKVLGKLQAVSRAGVFTQTAEHAARSIVGKCGEHLAPGGVIPVPAHYDQIFRAGQGTE